MGKIIGIGETVMDIIFRDDRPQEAVPGGSTFNAMISLGRTLPSLRPDMRIIMVTEIGDDHIGDIMMSFMERNSVSTEAVTRRHGSQSNISLAFLNQANDASYEFYRDSAPVRNAPEAGESGQDLVFEKDDIVLFGSFYAVNPAIRERTAGLLKRAREAGAILYYDLNFRKAHLKDLPEVIGNIRENIALSDFVRASSEDLRCVFGTSDGEKTYKQDIAPLCTSFILTNGAAPTEIRTGKYSLKFPVEQFETVSTIGAGDSFNAGFIYSLVRDGYCRGAVLTPEDWERLHATATRFSSEVCRSMSNYVGKDFRKLLYL